MIVDCHAHLVPRALIDKLVVGEAPCPSVAVEPAGKTIRLSFAGGPLTRPVVDGLVDLEGRAAWLADQGIDRQIVGPWLDMTGYQLPAEEGLAWSRFLNEALLQCSREMPALVPLATVPLQSGAAAAEVLREAHEAGFAGAMRRVLPAP